MKNKKRWLVFLGAIAVLAAFAPKEERAREENREPRGNALHATPRGQGGPKMLRATHRINRNNQPLGGLTQGPGFSIQWRGLENPHGADPIDAVAAAADRLAHLQGTSAGGDELAKEIWEVDKCLERLREIKRDRERRLKGNGGAGFGSPSPEESGLGDPPISASGAGFGGEVESQEETAQ